MYTENTRIPTDDLKLCRKISSICSEIFVTSVDKIADTIAIPYVLL
jgi:siroheme synthase (precorrin-2 oxidase/ferrochelatase)